MDVYQRSLPHGEVGHLGGSPLPAKGNACFFAGLPINGPDPTHIVDADTAKRLFPQYDGAFASVFWDAQSKVLVIATDCLGMQPLYLRHGDDGLIVVSETKAIGGDPDLAAWVPSSRSATQLATAVSLPVCDARRPPAS